MNIIINGFHDKKQTDVFNELMKKLNCSSACIILSESLIFSNKTISVFIVKDIIKGNYGDYCKHPFTMDFLHYIGSNFFNMMNMMNRFEVYTKKEMGFEVKKRIIYNHFSFWYSYFINNEIDLFISSNVPHDIYDYTILLVSKFFKKTKNLFFYQSQFKNMVIPMENIEDQNIEILKKYQSSIINSNKPVNLNPLAIKEWNLQNQSVHPFYMKKKRFKLKSIFSKICKISFNSFFLFFNKSKTIDLNNKYRRISAMPDFSKRFIYIPLHYQPELTTCPLGGAFTDQYLMISLLDSLLPEDVFIYIKEHPKQSSVNRYINYYEDILKETKHCFFVSKNIKSTELISNSIAVATVTGPAGWEALFKTKPVLLFGYNFYQYAPGVYHIKNEIDCERALSDILTNNYLYDEKRLKLFMNAVVDSSIHGFIDSVYAQNSDFNFEQSNTNIVNYIVRYCNV